MTFLLAFFLFCFVSFCFCFFWYHDCWVYLVSRDCSGKTRWVECFFWCFFFCTDESRVCPNSWDILCTRASAVVCCCFFLILFMCEFSRIFRAFRHFFTFYLLCIKYLQPKKHSTWLVLVHTDVHIVLFFFFLLLVFCLCFLGEACCFLLNFAIFFFFF